MLAEPEARQAALCVLVKTKEPRIEWHFSKRLPRDLADYLDKVRLVSEDIAAGKFYKRPGETLRVLRLPARLSGQPEGSAGNAGEDHLTSLTEPSKLVWLFFSAFNIVLGCF